MHKTDKAIKYVSNQDNPICKLLIERLNQRMEEKQIALELYLDAEDNTIAKKERESIHQFYSACYTELLLTIVYIYKEQLNVGD